MYMYMCICVFHNSGISPKWKIGTLWICWGTCTIHMFNSHVTCTCTCTCTCMCIYTCTCIHLYMYINYVYIIQLFTSVPTFYMYVYMYTHAGVYSRAGSQWFLLSSTHHIPCHCSFFQSFWLWHLTILSRSPYTTCMQCACTVYFKGWGSKWSNPKIECGELCVVRIFSFFDIYNMHILFKDRLLRCT